MAGEMMPNDEKAPGESPWEPHEAVEELARQLVWKQNQLDPQQGDLEFDEMDERDKQFFCHVVEWMLGDRATVMRALEARHGPPDTSWFPSEDV